MHILLDENITKELEKPLCSSGHTVYHASDDEVGLMGKEDSDVLKWAIENDSLIITQNGRHFIVLVPPKGGAEHSGLMWQKFQLTKPKAVSVGEKIVSFLKENTDTYNSISYIIRDKALNVVIEKQYPNE